MHGAEGIIPTPLWIVLFVIAAIIFVYMLFFADSGEGPFTQGILMGSVAVVITGLFLLLLFFDNPHHGIGKLEPTAMERTLVLADKELAVVGLELTPPCEADGTPN